ncbi:VOC family protein [Streptomyces sp. NPDC085639]|uniref:VOC family protein n=1 Tax=Streptomyces sp. NPDC085639 TaxID=3365734 RepID=UPI0037D68452
MNARHLRTRLGGRIAVRLPVLNDTPVGAFGMFHLAVDDFDAYVERIRPLVTVQKDVMEHRGDKLFYFTDPNGYVIGVNQKRTGEHHDADPRHHCRRHGGPL